MVFRRLLAILFFPLAAQAGSAVTYHGRIVGPGGEPVESPNVTFKIQVRSPGVNNCLLYEETTTLDLRNSSGVFVIPIGGGTGARTAADPGITIENVFSNNAALNFTSLLCNSGASYQPSPLDARKLTVSFNDGSGSGDQLLPPMDINYVPFSIHAQEAASALKVGAVPASQVMSVSGGAATPLSATGFAELLTLVNGGSSAYVKTSSVPTCAGGEVLKGVGGAFVCVADASGTDTLAGISCADGKILKRASGSWTCGDESGVGTESDPTVQSFAKKTVGTGLVVDGSDHLGVDFGTTAGKVAQGDDSRFTDARAPNGAATGDLSGSYPNPAVKAIRGNSVAATTPLNGQVYQWVNGSTEWQPKFISFADLKKSDGTAQMPGACAANQTLAWSAITDVFSCSDVGALDASKITSGTIAVARLPVGTAANTVAAGDDARFTNSRAPNGAAGGELGGTYPNPTVAKLAGASLNVSALTSGQILKYDGTNWVNAADNGVGAETDPTVAAFAKNAPATGLIVNGSNKIAPDFGTGAGKIVEGNDSRLSDARVASDINGLVATGIVQRTGAGTFAALGTTAPIVVSAGNVGLSVGSGLTLDSGNLVPDFGTVGGKVAQGNDSRFPSSTCASGSYNRWNGSAWVCDADAATDSTKVLKSGDTMTGALGLPSNGLAVGTSQLVVSGGNVGIGATSPWTRLHVETAAGTNNVLTLHRNADTDQNLIWMQGASALAAATPAWITGMEASSNDYFIRTWDGSTSSARITVQANTGNVGVGTTAPGQKLTVNGTIESLAGGIKFPDGTVQTTSATVGTNNTMISNWPDAVICTDGTVTRPMYLSATNTANITTYRAVTNSTDYLLQFTTSTGNYLAHTNMTGYDCLTNAWSISQIVSLGKSFNFVKGPAAQWIAGGSNAAYYNAGNVGIGTTSPAAKLDVAGEVKFGNTSSTCNSTNEGQQRYNSASHVMEYCNGTAWTAYGAGGGAISSCPSGWTMIGDAGKVGTFCIETGERAATTYWTASSTCNALNDATLGRARLCSVQEFLTACQRGSGLTAITNNAEWTSDLSDPTYAWTLGNGSCTTLAGAAVSGNTAYRCCVK